MKQLATPLGCQKTATKWLVIGEWDESHGAGIGRALNNQPQHLVATNNVGMKGSEYSSRLSQVGC